MEDSKPGDEPHLDLYTIPSHSSWFSWADIHETERHHLREFFDGSSNTRTPKIYKEYRDFIISKYRECPSRRLPFTEIRKSLVGDVSVLHKVFRFLDANGLINFSAAEEKEEEEREGEWKVRVEEGVPIGVRVVAVPNGKAAVLTALPGGKADSAASGALLPPLASYRDVYRDTKEEIVCRDCKQGFHSGYYQSTKEEGFRICTKCFKNGNHGKNHSVDDFKLVGDISNGENYSCVWTEAETLLLLESVLKHGDNWDLVAENVKTKNKSDCISKLIQLPFGDLMLGSVYEKSTLLDKDSNISDQQLTSSEPQNMEIMKREDEGPNVENDAENEKKNGNVESEKDNVDAETEKKNENEEIEKSSGDAETEKENGKVDDEKDNGNTEREKDNGDGETEKKNGNVEIEKDNIDVDSEMGNGDAETEKKNGDADIEGKENGDVVNRVSPLKRKRTNSSSDTCSSLMKQVVLLSSVVDPRITACAAEAAISALCNEIKCPREIFDGNDTEDEDLESSPQENNVPWFDGMDIDGKPTTTESQEVSPEKNALPLSLQIRAATATALGAAAARAKLLADQEDREIETLVANIIETQMKKVQHKSKYFDDLELMMEKEYTELEDLKESIIDERMNVLQRLLRGSSGSREQPKAKSQTGAVI